MEEKEIPVTIRFTAELKKRLDRHADDEGRSFNREVLWIISDWFKRQAASGTGGTQMSGKFSGIGERFRPPQSKPEHPAKRHQAG